MNQRLTLLSVMAMAVAGLLTCLIPAPSEAQLPRERAVQDRPIADVFWAPTNIGLSTVYNLSARNLNTSVTHTFGLVGGGIDRFFGMDDGANTRLGVEYGLSDRLSAGIGRMTFHKVVDVRGKYNMLRQTSSGSMPVDLAVKASAGMTTLTGMEGDFSDRLTYFASVMIARKMGGFSVQLSPMAAHFNTITGLNKNTLYGLGILAAYELSSRVALSGEYLPVIGERNPGTADALALALNIDTGGHVFQVFLTSSQWHNEQYIMAGNTDRFWEGDFRLGFNIHRVFGLGGRR